MLQEGAVMEGTRRTGALGHAFGAVASVVCALFCAGETAFGGESVSVGLAGNVILERCGATLAPKLFDKSWSACKVKGGWHPLDDGSYSSELCDKDGVVAAVVSVSELSLSLLNSIYAMIPPSIRIAAAAMMIATMIGALRFCCCL